MFHLNLYLHQLLKTLTICLRRPLQQLHLWLKEFIMGLTWSSCTPYNSNVGGYNVFDSKYKNLRYKISSVKQYKVTSTDMANLPGISYVTYGTVDLWRAILEFNGLTDPLSDIYPGVVLRLPSKTALLSVLSESNSSSNSASIVTI